jgi:transketolase
MSVAQLIGVESVRVVSIPCWEWFAENNENYRNEVLSWHIKKRVSIEAGSSLGWERFVGQDGLFIAVDDYGHSAPAGQLAKLYGFTPESIATKVKTHFQEQR